VVRGIGDENGVVGAHEEKRGISIHEQSAEAVVDALLTGEMSVHVVGGVEGIVSRSDVAGENGGVEFCLVPFPGVHGVGELCAVNANLPGKKAVRFESGLAEFGDSGLVVSREQFEREAPVLFEIEKLVLALGGSFFDRDRRVVHVIEQIRAAAVEEWPKIGRKSVDGAIDDQFVGVVAPGKSRGRKEGRRKHNSEKAENLEPLGHSERASLVRNFQPKRTALAAIGEVNHKSDEKPYKETNPIHDGKSRHEKQASEDGDDGSDGTAGSTEGARTVRFAITKDENAPGNQSKCEERADVRQVCEGADVEESGGDADKKARDPGGEVWRAISRMNAAENFGEQAVARHREPDTSLSQLEDQ